LRDCLLNIQTSDFQYRLPKELIAQTPMEPRDHSRLLVANRKDGLIKHRHFYDLPEYLRAGDLLVFNDSRVMAARIHGRRTGTGGRIEMLLLNRMESGSWRALVKPGRRMREGDTFEVSDSTGTIHGNVLEVEEDGSRILWFSSEENLHAIGEVPLPPYIHEPLEDEGRYQTVYARAPGSVAAPTAGLHFTEDLLERIRAMGVDLAFVTLHIGWDSFRPVQTEEFTTHRMHSEYWELGEAAARAINLAKNEGRRVISVGTTAVRTLEHVAALSENIGGMLSADSGWVQLFIYPGYRFRLIDGMVTNFHLPRSTLLMLTSAFAGREFLLRAYEEATAEGYRFYSFGDAMLIL